MTPVMINFLDGHRADLCAVHEEVSGWAHRHECWIPGSQEGWRARMRGVPSWVGRGGESPVSAERNSARSPQGDPRAQARDEQACCGALAGSQSGTLARAITAVRCQARPGIQAAQWTTAAG